jgi:hypothetical protein
LPVGTRAELLRPEVVADSVESWCDVIKRNLD